MELAILLITFAIAASSPITGLAVHGIAINLGVIKRKEVAENHMQTSYPSPKDPLEWRFAWRIIGAGHLLVSLP